MFSTKSDSDRTTWSVYKLESILKIVYCMTLIVGHVDSVLWQRFIHVHRLDARHVQGGTVECLRILNKQEMVLATDGTL